MPENLPETPSRDSLLTKLNAARERLAVASKRYENYDGNNPNKHRADVAEATAEVHRLESFCKEQGLIERSEDEVLWARIDAAFPEAVSRQIVEFEGACYQRRFSPVSRSLSGKSVKAWRTSWTRLEEDSEAVKAFRAPKPSMADIERNRALAAAWPFSAPAGGMTLKLQYGSPAVEASVAQKTIDYQRGHAVRRAHLTATVWASEEAVAKMLATLPRDKAAPKASPIGKTGDKPGLWLGTNEAGEPVYLRKKGAGHAGLIVAL